MRLSVRAALTPPYAQMLELADRPVSDAGAHKACGFDSRSVHHMHEWRNRNTRQAKDLVPAKGL